MTIPDNPTRAQLGAFGEELAVAYLRANGYAVIDRNWRCQYGELDIVAVENSSGAAVFVEVKTRAGDGFGGLAEAVPPDKVRRLRRLASVWLARQHSRWPALRIDVVGVRVGRRRTPEIAHLKGVG
ncbi:MAG TPA: YraN family protein [Mycobacterium sp.]|nr:YraN family protein [Mycobacterium sp.]